MKETFADHIFQGDAYMTNGDAHHLQMDRFMALYNRSDLYTLDIVRQHNKAMRDWSLFNNPYYFSAVCSLQYLHALSANPS